MCIHDVEGLFVEWLINLIKKKEMKWNFNYVRKSKKCSKRHKELHFIRMFTLCYYSLKKKKTRKFSSRNRININHPMPPSILFFSFFFVFFFFSGQIKKHKLDHFLSFFYFFNWKLLKRLIDSKVGDFENVVQSCSIVG